MHLNFLSLSSDHAWITLADQEFFSLSVKLKISLLYSLPCLWYADHFFSYALHPELSYIPLL